MIEVEETESGLRVWDSANSEVFIETVGWEKMEYSSEILRADHELRGKLRKLICPADIFSVEDVDGGNWETYGARAGRVSLQSSNYLIQIHSSVVIYVHFDGCGYIKTNGSENNLVISLSEQNIVEIGFRSRFRQPSEVLKIPDTPKGIAYYLTQSPKCFELNSPDKSFPSLRNHPPEVELVNGPLNNLEEDIDHLNDIHFHVPDRFEEVFVLSPLSHYLQANIHIEPRDHIKLSIPQFDFSIQFSNQQLPENELNRLLRKVFMLDCMVRDFGQYKTNLVERDLLEEIDLHGSDLYEESPESRLYEYLNSDFDSIEHQLPKWHLSMYIEPVSDSISALPYVLDRLATVYLPRSKKITEQEILEASLGKSTRSSSNRHETLTENFTQPELDSANSHGWLSNEIPFDAFKASCKSFENRFKYQQHVDDNPISVVVIINEHKMQQEFTSVYNIFSKRSDNANLNLEIHKKPRRKSLKDLMENSNIDFLHYIGHCDPEGLRCADGNLSMNSLGSCKVQTFFLNACGSVNEGMKLIEKGSVVGAVTLRPVLDQPAANVGSKFARLIINGFSFTNGLELAGREILMKKFYNVVGDGTHRLTNGRDPFPILLEVNRVDGELFKVASKLNSPQIAGSSYQPKLKGKEKFRLLGNETVDILSREELLEFLKESNSPVIYEDNLVWTDDVVERLE